MESFDYVILGGGVAGLCAAKRLLELGITPLIIEAGSYPSHKVCGEFLSPSSLTLLKKWNIHPIPIHQIQLHTHSKNFNLTLPYPAGSLSHLSLDFELANQISQKKAHLYIQTKVIHLSPSTHKGECHHLTLSSGKEIKAKNLLIATGRLPHQESSTFHPRYIGFKAHFSGLKLDSTLYMFSFKGAYLGVSPVENGNANLACLAKIEDVQLPPQQFMQNLISSHPVLERLLASGCNVFDQWMEARVPKFGLRSPPNWPQTYWIGDAAGTIPPASGNGLSLAMASGCLAAEFAVQDDPLGFKKAWQQCCSSQIRCAKGLHHLFLNPSLATPMISFIQWFPFIAQRIFQTTRF